jgi:LPPG:FO 2-phospho-L-lactate transferase
MTDAPVRTVVHTPDGKLAFQDYFVRYRCAPVVSALTFAGAAQAQANPACLAALRDPALAAIVICPSNPYLSIDPILAVPGMRAALECAEIPVIAVSPVIAGEAVKGPTAKIMRELGIAVTSRAIAEHYASLIDGLVIDESDAADADGIGVAVAVTRTLMKNIDDKRHLARAVLAFAKRVGTGEDSARQHRAGR